MKKGFILTFVILSNLSLISQNWNPVNPDFKYNYRHDTAQYISNTIYIDSFKIINGDSVFYLNRIMTACDTCNALPWGQYYYNLKNQPQFLQRKMIRIDEDVWMFDDTARFYLNSGAELGESWVFDSIQNITAQVDQKYLGSIFNMQDSIKRISLSDGRELSISKNYGIIAFDINIGESIYLEGIEGLDLGVQIPKFHDFFNFQVGDVFQYYGWAGWATGSGYESVYTHEKMTILNKYVYPDSVRYDIHRMGRKVYWDTSFPYDTSYFNESGSISFIDSSEHICNKFNNEILRNPDDIIIGEYSHFTKVGLSLEDDTLVSKGFGSFQYDNSVFTYQNYPDTSLHEDLLEACCADQYINTYKTGLGETYYDLWIFELEQGRELIGYIKNGDTVGIIIDDSTLTSTYDLMAKAGSFSIYPNPAAGHFYIDHDNNISGKLILDIYTVNGVKIRSLSLPQGLKTHCIQVPELTPGLYIVVLRDRKQNQYKKLIIK